ncbi:hypothetical protein GCM10022215_00970 [Nocardioides fonticola]|uniref:Uncharacterized protein n=1 Tax=Nocardioides fonticola TaxID=450363 RepID=A0ABP7X8Y8_9ACTN
MSTKRPADAVAVQLNRPGSRPEAFALGIVQAERHTVASSAAVEHCCASPSSASPTVAAGAVRRPEAMTSAAVGVGGVSAEGLAEGVVDAVVEALVAGAAAISTSVLPPLHAAVVPSSAEIARVLSRVRRRVIAVLRS